MRNIKMSNVLYGLVAWVLAAAFALPVSARDCSGSSKHSSEYLCMGVSGWKLGRNCPNTELYWKHDSEGADEILFKDLSGKVSTIPSGMATFNSTCQLFWHVKFGPEIEYIEKISEPDQNKKPRKAQLKVHAKKASFNLFSVQEGKLILKVEGEYPAWSHDGQSVYFFRSGKSGRQLWELDVASKNEIMIIEVQDFLPCFQQGDEVEWYPVVVTKEGNILWWYWVGKKDRPMATSAKKLYIDAKTRKVIRVDDAKSCPCFPTEKERN
jgi:hypothetical protein